MLICGSSHWLDVENLRSSVVYSGGYTETDSVIVYLWEVLRELTIEQQGAFLKFVTGCSRGPLLGFQQLHPRVCIQKASPAGRAGDRLPTTSTCVNLLKLPPYETKSVLKEKLIYAISTNSGFHLS